jgi:putative ABC transport system permease protein
LILVQIILPYFNSTFSLDLGLFHSGNTASISLQIVLCLLIVVALSGFYPAIFLSGYNISKVLKGNYTTGNKGAAFRNALIVVQFTVSAFFIIGTLIIGNQMNYMKTKDKGFSGSQVMRLEARQKIRDADFETVRNTLLNIPGVEYVSKTTTVPGDAVSDTSTIPYKLNGKEYRMGSVKISTEYFKTLSIPLVRGRMFNSSYNDQNTRTAIINETAAKKFNLQNIVGSSITFPNCDSIPVQIIGIVKDFNVSGLENAIQPMVFTIGNKTCMFQSGGGILVKLNSGHMQNSVAAIEEAWKKIDPDFPIRYSFLDDNFQKLFASHIHLQQVINFFGATAILISAMGLFALTAFLINRRMKEIGIRKILGAGISDLGLLLSKDFMRLIAIAVIIAIPIGWWTASKWLDGFAYRITLSWWIFVASALIIVIIAILAIGIQTLRAAVANPVKSLRNE